MKENQILIIEDDIILNDGIKYNLEKNGMNTYSAYNLKEAILMLSKNRYSLIIVDVNLPDGDGFSFAKKYIHSTPFIFLTAHNLDEEILKGFEVGADDYITKPFNIKILLERVRVVLSRTANPPVQNKYILGNLEINIDAGVVKKNGTIINLTPTEFNLLIMFISNRNQILSKEQILNKIWDRKGNFVNEHTLTLNISRLRNKIEDDDNKYISTIYGMGYKWNGG